MKPTNRLTDLFGGPDPDDETAERIATALESIAESLKVLAGAETRAGWKRALHLHQRVADRDADPEEAR